VFITVAYNRKNCTYGEGTHQSETGDVREDIQNIVRIYLLLKRQILYKFNPFFLTILMKDFKFPASLFSIFRRDSLIIQPQYTFHH
jgi:hypothetical protein